MGVINNIQFYGEIQVMSLNYEPYSVLTDQARAELRRQIDTIDPTVFGSFASPFLSSAAALSYSTSLTVRDLEKQLFPQTAEGEFLDRWGAYEILPRLSASPSIGDISVAGTVSTTIPVSTQFTSEGGLVFTSTNVATIQSVGQSISSITRVGTTATVTTNGDHTLASNLDVTISGANEAEYNGTFSITVTARNQFTYTVSGSPATPATGAISLSSDYAIVSLQCDTTGQSTNLSNGAPLTNATYGTGYAQFDGLSGGADTESDDAYEARILLSRSSQAGVFTKDQVRLAALSVAGNTRAFVVTPSLSVAQTGVVVVDAVSGITRVSTTATVTTSVDHGLTTGQFVTIIGANEADYNGAFQVAVTGTNQFTYTVSGSPSTPATGTISALYTANSGASAGFVPSPGQVAVYVLRDNDANIIPTQTILDQTKQAIIDNGKLNAQTFDGDVFVFAPEAVDVDFDFTSLVPDTPTMRSAVQSQIAAFFQDSVDFEEDVLQAAYLGAIQNTQDLETGDFVQSFSLSTPSGNVSVADGQIAVLGDVTFSI